MDLSTATSLIKDCVPAAPNQLWWDLGAGSGLFTRALAGILESGTIIAIDQKSESLGTIPERIGDVEIGKLVIDFTKLGDVDQTPSGILMANSLHFVKDKLALLKELKSMLAKDGRLVIVEYEMKAANSWVPYPIDFTSLSKLASDAGFTQVRKVASAPSRYQADGMYSAVTT